MIKELFGMLKDMVVRIVTSRLFALGVVFTCLFSVLILRLFDLQILHGEEYLDQYKDRTLREVTTVGTRGNIYDANGKLLAYNELQYNVTIADNGAYTTSNADINRRNNMLLQLARLIDKYGYTIEDRYEVSMDENGEMYFTTGSESAHRRFIANVFGRDADQLTDAQLSITAREAFETSKSRYRFDDVRDEDGNAIVIDDRTALNMINIFFTMRLTAYQKYQTTTIVENVSQECVAEILEAKSELQGVDIETVSVRQYNYAPYFSHIVGYTGKIQQAQLEELQKTDDSYELNDVVGVWGLEKSMESTLKGEKGHRSMYLNSVGSILEVVSETGAKAGNDIYTTIAVDDQIAVYHLLEQQLAGILAAKITESDASGTADTDASSLMIPVKDAYFQLINNNVLTVSHFSAEDAGYAEQRIAEIFQAGKASALDAVRTQLLSSDAAPLGELPIDLQAYMVYIYEYLTSDASGIIDRNSQSFKESDAYAAWREDTISLRDFIISGIEESWLNTANLPVNSAYSNTDSIFQALTSYIMDYLESEGNFEKRVYKYLIDDETLPGYLLCMALYEQGILAEDEERYAQLAQGDAHYAYQFLISKIVSIEITPAQLALEPCNGAVTITDVNTGKVKALVTYPGFDNNQISNAEYLAKCNADLSLPLLNCATQTQLAPGSSFKPISSIASLEEQVIDLSTVINCTGRYEEVTPNIRCWIWPSRHNEETIVDGIKNSCNFFFAELGHRLATDGEGNYSQEYGLQRLAKYAAMFGLDRTSGVEIDETQPQISDSDAERSAMGQGTHAFNNVQLARYTTALANGGTVYDLSLVDRITEADGTLIETVEPKVSATLDFSESTWNAVHTGLRLVITEGVARSVFAGQDIEVAGKTGTAQERRDEANHADFISYAPYSNPEITVTVNIPNGYSSGNAAALANRVYNYYYGKDSLDQILARDASGISSINVSD